MGELPLEYKTSGHSPRTFFKLHCRWWNWIKSLMMTMNTLLIALNEIHLAHQCSLWKEICQHVNPDPQQCGWTYCRVKWASKSLRKRAILDGQQMLVQIVMLTSHELMKKMGFWTTSINLKSTAYFWVPGKFASVHCGRWTNAIVPKYIHMFLLNKQTTKACQRLHFATKILFFKTGRLR